MFLGPPGSGSVPLTNGSGSFYHQAKIVIKTLIPAVIWLLYDFLSQKNDVNVLYIRKVKSRKMQKKIVFCWRIEGQGRKQQDPDPLVRGPDPDPYQNVTDPQHCSLGKDKVDTIPYQFKKGLDKGGRKRKAQEVVTLLLFFVLWDLSTQKLNHELRHKCNMLPVPTVPLKSLTV